MKIGEGGEGGSVPLGVDAVIVDPVRDGRHADAALQSTQIALTANTTDIYNEQHTNNSLHIKLNTGEINIYYDQKYVKVELSKTRIIQQRKKLIYTHISNNNNY